MARMENVANIFKTHALPVSFEIFPPKGDLSLQTAREVAGGIARIKPDFVSVTYSAAGSGNGHATTAIAAMIQDDFGIPSVAHLTCVSATDASLEAAVADMRARGISTVLALRGDLVDGQEPSRRYRYAKDLIPILKDAGFCVGAAAYPEGHIACEDDAANIEHLKAKQDAGADFFVTQLAFDNERIYRFLDAADAAGVTAPITCGIMPFMSKSQVSRMIFMCGASLPSPVIKLLAKHEDDAHALRQAGVDYACKQLVGLASHGVRGLHVYSMNHPDIAEATMEALRQAGFRERNGAEVSEAATKCENAGESGGELAAAEGREA